MAYKDLLIDNSVAVEGGNYFIITVTDLNINETYPIQFRYKYQDGTFGLWSASRLLVTPGETLPGSPSLSVTDVVGDDGFIKITWNGNDKSGRPITNIDRIDIFIDGAPFDGTKAAGSFKTAGTQTIAAPAGQYAVALYAISSYGSKSAVSDAQDVIVTKSGQSILNPEDPYAPTVTSGLASVIVGWNGKKSDGDGGFEDFTSGSFAGAKVFIGESADFVPSDNNWVHTLNFANGYNEVSIGVGTIINKSLGLTLGYNTPYYVKIDTVNASKVANGQPIAAEGNPITVAKLPASEIKTGFLEADAYIKAGASSGARVEMSGSASPFVIYGTDGTTKLLEFIGGSTGTLAINGSGTFTGNLSIGSGNEIFKADPSTGIWLGNANFSSSTFSVSRSGYLKATIGEIAGWTIASTYLQNATGTLKINGGYDPALFIGSASGAHIRIAPDSMTHYNGGSPTGKFTLNTSTGNLTMNGGTLTNGEVNSSTITGTTINVSGRQVGTGSGTIYDENSDSSTKINFTEANFSIIPAYDTWTDTVSTGYYDPVSETWISGTTTTTNTTRTLKITDSIEKGGVPTSGYYSELWLQTGTSSGDATIYGNYPGGYISFEVRSNSTEKAFYMNGYGENWTNRHETTTLADQPAVLQADANGKITRGRAFFSSGSSSTTILGTSWQNVGQNGDIVFSTNN